jgi:hypothetical protein
VTHDAARLHRVTRIIETSPSDVRRAVEDASPDEVADACALLELSVELAEDHQRLIALRMAYLQAAYPELAEDDEGP